MSSYALVCRFYRLFRSWVRGPEVVVLIISSAREGTTRQGTQVGFSLRLVLPVYVRGYIEQLPDSFVKEGVIKELIGKGELTGKLRLLVFGVKQAKF